MNTIDSLIIDWDLLNDKTGKLLLKIQSNNLEG